MGLCPTVYTTVRTFFLGQMPGEWSYSIAGQLTWVNLLYEIINEAIILPLFYFMGAVTADKKEFSNSKRAKTIKNGDCDVAIRLMCNEVGSSTSGCYVQATKKNTDFGQILIDEYAAATGIRIQTGKGKGVEKISSDSVASNCGCPCVRLIMGNWKNKSERANLQDEAFQEKMMQAIYEALLKQLKK